MTPVHARVIISVGPSQGVRGLLASNRRPGARTRGSVEVVYQYPSRLGRRAPRFISPMGAIPSGAKAPQQRRPPDSRRRLSGHVNPGPRRPAAFASAGSRLSQRHIMQLGRSRRAGRLAHRTGGAIRPLDSATARCDGPPAQCAHALGTSLIRITTSNAPSYPPQHTTHPHPPRQQQYAITAEWEQKETCNSRDPLVATCPATNLPLTSLITGERTGSDILLVDMVACDGPRAPCNYNPAHKAGRLTSGNLESKIIRAASCLGTHD